MNKEEAIELKNAHLGIIGEEIEGKEVYHIFLAPSNGDRLGDIIGAIIMGEPYEHLYNGYDDFEVRVLYDVPKYFASGFIFQELLTRALNKRST